MGAGAQAQADPDPDLDHSYSYSYNLLSQPQIQMHIHIQIQLTAYSFIHLPAPTPEPAPSPTPRCKPPQVTLPQLAATSEANLPRSLVELIAETTKKPLTAATTFYPLADIVFATPDGDDVKCAAVVLQLDW